MFTFAVSIQPGTESASNVQDVLNTYGNGYFIDSLHDLSSAPAGTLNGITAYRAAVNEAATSTKAWANRLHIKYGYGVGVCARSSPRAPQHRAP